MELLSSKIVAMVLMGALALFFGLLPLKVKPMILKGDENSRRRRKREMIVSALLCFGSGVLVATVFIHMLPETREGFEKSRQLGLLGKTDHETQASHSHEHHVEPHGTLHSKNGKIETPLTNNHSSHSHSGLTLHEKEGRSHQDIAEHNHKDTPRDHIGMDTHKHLSYHSHEHNDNSSHDHEIYFHRDGNIPHRITEPAVRPNKNEHHDHDARGNHEHDAHANHEHDAHANHEHDAHANHEHDAHGNHEHDSHGNHEHDANGNHEHDAHGNHEHDAHGNHEHDANGNHEHDAHGNHEHDAHGNHEHDAHTNHEHDTHDNHDHDAHIENHAHGAHDIHKSHNNGSNVHNESESNLREKNKFHSENDNWKSAENGKNTNENNSDRQTGIPIVNKNKNNANASVKFEKEHIHEKEKDGIRKPTPVQPLLIPALSQPLLEPTTVKPVMTSNWNVKNVTEEPMKETSKSTNTNPKEIPHHNHNSPLLKASEPEKVQAVIPLNKTKKVDSGTPNKEFPSDAVKENEQIDTDDPKHPEHHHHYGDNGEPHFEDLSQLPEPSHKGDDAHDHKDDSHSYPLAELTICVGFFLIYFLEEMIHKALFKHPEEPYEKKDLVNGSGIDAKENHVSHAHNHSHVPPFHSHSPAVGNGHIPRECKGTQIPNGHTVMENSYPMETQHSYQKNMAPVSEWGAQGVDNPVFAGDIDATSWNPKIKNSVLSNGQISPMPLNDLSKSSTTSSTAGSTVLSLPPETISSSPPEKVPLKTVILSNLRSLLVVIALSFHAVFEGMAVGLQEYSSDVWYLFLAIAAHKFVILFCIGLELMVAGTPLVLMVLYMVILALVTPFGIAIGIVVTENSAIGGSEHLLVVTILQGLAGGTLLYVAFLEVLERERAKPGGRILKFFCLVIGFACMASVEAIMGGHSH